MAKIYSLASNDVVITKFKKRDPKSVGANSIETAIIIKGGANVRNKHGQTAKHVMTEVSKEDLAILESNSSFKRKVKAGFLFVDNVPGEAKSDKSAQLTAAQMKAKSKGAELKTGKAEE